MCGNEWFCNKWKCESANTVLFTFGHIPIACICESWYICICVGWFCAPSKVLTYIIHRESLSELKCARPYSVYLTKVRYWKIAWRSAISINAVVCILCEMQLFSKHLNAVSEFGYGRNCLVQNCIGHGIVWWRGLMTGLLRGVWLRDSWCKSRTNQRYSPTWCYCCGSSRKSNP